MHIPILTEVQTGRMNLRAYESCFAKKYFFLKFIYEMKVTCRQIAKFIFQLFTINTFFLRS